MSDAVAIAVDGGDSKTDLALVRDDGAVLAVVRGPRSSPQRIGVDGCPRGARRPARRGAAIAGPRGRRRPAVADVARDPARRRRLPAGGGGPCRRPCTRARLGDVDHGRQRHLRRPARRHRPRAGAWRSCAAPGSTASASARTAREARFPALGLITGDWGGGEDVGLAGLAAAARSADGRGPSAPRSSAPCRRTSGSAPRRSSPRRSTSAGSAPSGSCELAPVVLAEAESDAVARAIVDRLAAEIVALARVALTRLELLERAGRGAPRRRAGALDGRGGWWRRSAPRARPGRPAGRACARSTSPPVVGAGAARLDELGADDAKARAGVR